MMICARFFKVDSVVIPINQVFIKRYLALNLFDDPRTDASLPPYQGGIKWWFDEK